ncbi:MAG: glycosyltransferase [Burkholderiaceae bacterium]|nr:glycosyltransferase [Burkholderiaceae bacterium]
MALGNFQSVVLHAAGWQPVATAAGHAWALHAPLVAAVLAAVRPRAVLAVDAGEGVALGGLADAVRWLGLDTRVQGALHSAPDASHPTAVDVLHLADVPPGGLAAALAQWQPALTDTAVVLLHGCAAHGPEWATLAAQAPHFVAPAGEGLGILLAPGATLPEGLHWLLDPNNPQWQWTLQAPELTALFGALGAGAAARVALLGTQAGNADLRLRLAAQNQSAQQTQWQAKAELHQAQQEHEGLLLTLQKTREQLQASAQALEQARQEAGIGAAALERVHASLSWRITAPLRAGLDTVRRLAQLARLTSSQGSGPALAQAQQLLTRAQDALHGGPRLPHLTGDFPLRTQWYAAQAPQVSLIVLNYNKPQLTLECVQSIWQHTQGYRYEVVLVDNGSTNESLAQLAPLGVAAQLVRVGMNRFFGEGNNIGFEASLGRYVVFLNNDVTVTPGWLAPLIDRLEADPTMGATGPMMVYPDGRLQEAGAQVHPDGSSEQFGKGGNPDDPAHAQQRDVGYVSAAAVAMRRETFAQVLGFDLCYEPAYYEDADLCMKIRQMGLRIVYCPDSRIVHHENATSRDFAKQLAIEPVIRRNRAQFVTRWGAVLRGEATTVAGLIPATPVATQAAHVPGRPAVVLFTPYHLVPGGGERYLLTVAAGLARSMNVTLATQHPYSRLRLLKLGQDLDLPLEGIALATTDALARLGPFDWSVVMGNEVLPPCAALARRNVFICQFPFPTPADWLGRHVGMMAGYERVVLYSPFVAKHYSREAAHMGVGNVPVSVVSPSAVLAPPASLGVAVAPKRQQVVSVGRFFVGGHSKRHDFMIEAFKKLHARNPDTTLHLAGSLSAEPRHMAHYEKLVAQAAGLPVQFHVNASQETIAALYADSSVYWHAAGVGVDELVEPHRCEHFGISVVEAMSAGCVPMVFRLGGPAATVQHKVSGYIYSTPEELVDWTAQVLGQPEDDASLRQMRATAVQTSLEFSDAALMDRFTALLA